MTAMVERDPAAVQFVRETLSAPVTSVWPLDRVVDHLRRDPTEDVVVLGPSVTDEEARAFAEHSMIHRPALGVIRIRAGVDNAVLADAFRAGMSAVVESGDATGLRNAVRRAGALARAVLGEPPPGGRGAGPAGAAPHRLLHQGRRGQEPGGHQPRRPPWRTRGTVSASSTSTSTGATSRSCCSCPRCTPSATSAGSSGGIDVSGVQSLLTEHSDGLSVLAAPVQLGGAGRASSRPAWCWRCSRACSTSWSSTPRGPSTTTRSRPSTTRDLLVLVGTLDIPALKSLKLATGTLDLLNFPRDRWRLVLNRADSKVGLSGRGVRGDAGPQRHREPRRPSRDVLAAVNRGEPIVRANRGHQVSKALDLVRGVTRCVQRLHSRWTRRCRPDAGRLRRGAHAKRVG